MSIYSFLHHCLSWYYLTIKGGGFEEDEEEEEEEKEGRGGKGAVILLKSAFPPQGINNRKDILRSVLTAVKINVRVICHCMCRESASYPPGSNDK